MKLAHNIGNTKHSNYNTEQQILECKEPIGFDGIYKNVFENRHLLKGKSGVFFVMGDYVGKDNTFDLKNVPKLEQYCTWEEVKQMAEETGFEIGWHTWSHRDLTTLSEEEIIKEITPPFPMKYFAYPYGRYNDLVVKCVEKVGFEDAWSVTQGTDERFKRIRNYI